MHERSVAEDLVKAAGITAFEAGGRVRAMHIHIGGLSCIDPSALRDQVKWYSDGTIAEGAEVFVEVIPAELGDAHGEDVRLVAVDLAS